MSDGNAAALMSGGAPAPDPLVGRSIAGRFTITRLLARGGMGKVYLAEQAPLGRLCAVKILNPNYTGDGDPEFHRRFFREASISSKITHPNSVTVFDYGKTDDDIYYMAMEYLEGQTLHQHLRENGPMVEDRVGKIASQLCRALREAHRLDVIHRDLKPANIFLTRHGDDGDFVKVLDFGLVKHLSERPEEQLTQTGLFMGSPKYMAPEQIQGGVVDARTDVYSLGIMMYEMLVGKVPFERPTSVSILMAHVGELPPPMRSINPHLVCAPPFEEIVMRCIAKDPGERFASMDELLFAIKRTQGVTFTGQLAALSGGYAGFSSAPPPVVTSQPPPAVTSQSGAYVPVSRSGESRMLASGGLTPVGVGGTIDTTGLRAQLRPRSRAWVPLGVLGAAVVGGLLGVAAFRLTAPASEVAEVEGPPATAQVTPPTTTPATSAAAPVATASKAAARAPVEVTTDPPGARAVAASGSSCDATPCALLLEPGTAHDVTFTKPGYRMQSREVRVGEPPGVVLLVRDGRREEKGRPPAAKPGPGRPNGPAAPPTSPSSADAPSGFKDTPY